MPNVLKKLAEQSASHPGFVPMTVALAAFSPYWSIESHYADAAMAALAGEDFNAHGAAVAAMQSNDAEDGTTTPYDIDDGIATINVTGPITKRPSSWGTGCSALLTRRALRLAVSDTNVKAIALVFDSPGGSVDGIADLSSDIFDTRGAKPIGAYLEDKCCSAAYWLASQCDFIYCSQTALVGSIGTMTVLKDSSEMAKTLGVRVIPIGTGKYKADYVDGAPVGEDIVADTLRICTEINEQFLAHVKRGRGFSNEQIDAITDARVYVGQNAVPLGLVDKVATLDQFYAKLGASANAATDQLADESSTPEEDMDDMGDGPQTAASSGTREETMAGETITIPPSPRGWLAALFARNGDKDRAAAVLSAKDDSDEAIGAQLATIAKVDMQGETPTIGTSDAPRLVPSLAQRTAADGDILAACRALGISSAQEMKDIFAYAKLGKQFDEETRKDSKAEAIRAFGAQVGKAMEATCDSLPIEHLIPMRDGWRAVADKTFGIGENGQAATRKSTATANVAVNAERVEGDGPPQSKWEQLDAATRENAKKIAPRSLDTPEKREAYAKIYLEAKGGE